MKLTKNKAIKNILFVWNQCTEQDKIHWYEEANKFALLLTKESHLTIQQTCGIIAALSPLKQWNENKRIAALLTQDINTKGIHTPLCTNKARKIANLSSFEADNEEIINNILKGQKIKAFFHNILHPNYSINVTIDRHALSIAVGKKLTGRNMKMSEKEYNFYVSAYKETAKKLNISPVLLQSATWNRWRNPQFNLF